MTNFQRSAQLAKAILAHPELFNADITRAAHEALYGPLLPKESRKAYTHQRMEQLFRLWPADVLLTALRHAEAYRRSLSA